MGIEFRDQKVQLNEAKMILVPRGEEHKPFADEECKMLIVKPKDVLNTGDVEGEVKNKLKKKLTNVFIPTTPNPTSGFLLMVPNTELKKLNVSVDDAIKTIVSAGIIKLESKRNKNS